MVLVTVAGVGVPGKFWPVCCIAVIRMLSVVRSSRTGLCVGVDQTTAWHKKHMYALLVAARCRCSLVQFNEFEYVCCGT